MNDRLRVDQEIKKTIRIREWMPKSEDVAGKVQEVGSGAPVYWIQAA